MSNKLKQTDSIRIKPLKTDDDFKELLSLTDLGSQMGLLDFLTNNLKEYQNNYLNSFLMNIEKVIENIPESDYQKYFPPNLFFEVSGSENPAWRFNDKGVQEFLGIEGVVKYFKGDYFRFKGLKEKGKNINRHNVFCLNTKDKKLYYFPYSLTNNLTFSKKGDLLLAKGNYKEWDMVKKNGAPYQKCEYFLLTVKIDLKTNNIVSVEKKKEYEELKLSLFHRSWDGYIRVLEQILNKDPEYRRSGVFLTE